MNENYITILVTSNDLGKRVDLLISNKLKNISRNRLKSLILQGNLTFKKKIIDQPSYKLKNPGNLLLFIPEPLTYDLIPENIGLNIVYEDQDLVVVDKEAGIVVHPGSGNYNGTLVNALLYHCGKNLSGIGGVLRPGVVHRIDKMTSGLLVFAKDDATHNGLAEQFKNKTTSRKYSLLSWNMLPASEGKIKASLSRSRFNRKKMSVTTSKFGKIAITKYNLIKCYDINQNIKITHAKCQLFTGRTHQIRVHLSYIGNPLIGDKKYSRNNHYLKLPFGLKELIYNNFIKTERHALHASLLGFYHPKKKKYFEFESKLPKDFKVLLNYLNTNINMD